MSVLATTSGLICESVRAVRKAVCGPEGAHPNCGRTTALLRPVEKGLRLVYLLLPTHGGSSSSSSSTKKGARGGGTLRETAKLLMLAGEGSGGEKKVADNEGGKGKWENVAVPPAYTHRPTSFCFDCVLLVCAYCHM